MEPTPQEIEELLARARATSEANATPPPRPPLRRAVLVVLVRQAVLIAVLMTLAVLLVLGVVGALRALF